MRRSSSSSSSNGDTNVKKNSKKEDKATQSLSGQLPFDPEFYGVGFLLIFTISRKIIFNKLLINISKNKKREKNNFIDGEFEDIENDDDRKI